MLGLLYSLVAYLAFLLTFSAFALFTDGILLPRTVDTGEPGALAPALAINVGVILAWGLQHSLMARQTFKDWLLRFVPAHLERSTYVLVASLGLLGVMLAWQPMSGVLWHVETGALMIGLWVVNGIAWVAVPVASFLIDHFEVFGLKQTFMRWRKQSYEHRGFVAPYVYRYVRHPMMTGILIAMWATPYMTVSHLVMAVGMSVYIYIGVHFEERSLVRELGQPYSDYLEHTPKFVPGLPDSQGAPAPASGDA